MTIVEKLTPNPPVTEAGFGGVAAPAAQAKPALTQEEAGLLARSVTFIKAALLRNGISLSPTEAPWIGAEVADFVLKEMGVEQKAEAPKTEVPTPGFKPA
jgi:hypothetical protein